MLNGRQYEVGQCIVLPLRHAPTILDLSDAEAAAVMCAAKRIAQVMVAAFSPDGILLYQNNGVGSLQEVPHCHLHVVPRQPGSNWGDGPPHLARLDHALSPSHQDHTVLTDEKRRTVEQLREHCKRP